MGVGVATLAVGVPRIVVTEAAALGNEALPECHDVVDQRVLILVDEESAGRVERIHERDPRRDRRSMERVPDQLRDVGGFGPALGLQRERRVEDLHARRSLPGVDVGFTGRGPALAAPRPPITIPVCGEKSQSLPNDDLARPRRFAAPAAHVVLGSRRSRRPSPTRLSPSTVSAIAPPGNSA